MTDVSVDARPRARVLPRVFADVPTAAELATMRASRDQLRGIVNMLMALLFVVVLAAGAGFYYLTTIAPSGNELVEERLDIEKAVEAMGPALAAAGLSQQGEITPATLEAQITALGDAFSNENEQLASYERYYEDIDAARLRVDVLNEEIDELRASAKFDNLSAGQLRTIAGILEPRERGLSEQAGLSSFPEWLDALQTALRDYEADLETVKAELDEWRPPRASDPRQ